MEDFMEPQIMYAHQRYVPFYGSQIFVDIGSSFFYTRAHDYSAPVHKVQATEASPDQEADVYYGWLNFKTGQVSMVFHHPSALEVCFPYGTQAEIKAGRGHIVRLLLEDLGVVVE